jgi:hypothetical protein
MCLSEFEGAVFSANVLTDGVSNILERNMYVPHIGVWVCGMDQWARSLADRRTGRLAQTYFQLGELCDRACRVLTVVLHCYFLQ